MKDKTNFQLKITRLILMQKRLLYKKSFIFILILISLFSFTMFISSKNNGSLIKIALYADFSKENVGKTICTKLLNSNNRNFSLINYTLFTTKEEAISSVDKEQNDASWVFQENIDESIIKNAQEEMIGKAVKVYQKNDSIKLSFAKEILYSKLFSEFSTFAYKAFLKNRYFFNNSFSEENADEIYDDFINKNILFNIKKTGISKDINFLLSPLRGLLCLFVMICSFTGTIYHIEDKKRGQTLFFTKQVVIFDGSLIMIFQLILFKIYTNLLFELFAIILFSISLYHFTDILAGLTKSTDYFVCFIPILIILSLIFTPIFLNLAIFKPIQMLFPSYYYLTSVYYPKNFIPFVIYTIILCGINCFQKRITINHTLLSI